MTDIAPLATSGERPERPISIAILAMGGQGGGVLCDWIVALAEQQGWIAQSTSVPGVAQRTGATIYYIEMLPARAGRLPVLSLTPTPGDVDVVMAAEFMEAGRSLLRGLVTPERTTLIASTHRSFAVAEKEKPGGGIADPGAVTAAVDVAARRAVLFDMQTLAERNGSVISAALFGALAGAGVLPFARSAFEASIRAGGKGVEPSLRAFAAAAERAADRSIELPRPAGKALPAPPRSVGQPKLDALLGRLHDGFPEPLHPILFAGLRRCVDYQDAAYGTEYLTELSRLLERDHGAGGTEKEYAFSAAAAKYLATAMSYDDVIRVADLKTRASRFARIDRETGRKPDQILYMTEFMHPRIEEIVGTLPASLGHSLERRPGLMRRLGRLTDRGRRVRTGTVSWFLLLYAVSALRRARRKLLRHQRELAHIREWLTLAEKILVQDYDLAVEVLASRRLVKGYSDTHARGLSKFDRVLGALPALSSLPDAAGWLNRLVRAALADEDGTMLDGALRTLADLQPATSPSEL